jgi:DNA-binding XRE family transcriptional regulator
MLISTVVCVQLKGSIMLRGSQARQTVFVASSTGGILDWMRKQKEAVHMTQTLVRPMAFKDRLRALRKAAGVTQMGLAAAAGLTLSAVTQMEAGKILNPRLDTLRALARVLGCTLDDLGQNGDDDQAGSEPETPPEPPGRRQGKKGKRGPT